MQQTPRLKDMFGPSKTQSILGFMNILYPRKPILHLMLLQLEIIGLKLTLVTVPQMLSSTPLSFIPNLILIRLQMTYLFVTMVQHQEYST